MKEMLRYTLKEYLKRLEEAGDLLTTILMGHETKRF